MVVIHHIYNIIIYFNSEQPNIRVFELATKCINHKIKKYNS